jgi:cytochrome P450
MAATAASPLPPGPPLPKWMQTAGFILAPVPWIRLCQRRYGDVVTFRSLFDPGFVMVFEPELVKQVFRGPPDRLHAGEANALLGPVVGEHSLLLLDGSEHLRQRKLLLPPFHGQRMRKYEEVMVEATDRAIDSWRVGEDLTLLPSMYTITLEVIVRTVFGVEDTTRRDELMRRLRSMSAPVSTRLGLLLMVLARNRGRESKRIADFEARRDRVDELLYAEIENRRGQPDLAEREDVLSLLQTATDEDGTPMTDLELRDELVTLLVAGHETTAAGLAWAFELLMRNPDVLAKAREGDDKYLDALVKEALRIRPVISGVGRVVRGDEPFEVGGHLIPPGMEINPNIAAVHRRADRYPEVDEFRPERFLGEDPPDTYTWIPFGGGTRRCIGASFASFEMRTVIRRVLERADLRPAGRPDRGVRKGVTFVPKRGTRAKLVARH